MSLWQWALVAAWLLVAFAITIVVNREPSSLAYRLTGDRFLGWLGKFFTALHWPVLVPIFVVIAVFDSYRRA